MLLFALIINSQSSAGTWQAGLGVAGERVSLEKLGGQSFCPLFSVTLVVRQLPGAGDQSHCWSIGSRGI